MSDLENLKQQFYAKIQATQTHEQPPSEGDLLKYSQLPTYQAHQRLRDAIPQRTLITHEFEVTEQPFGFDYLSRGDLFMEVEGFKNFGVSAPIFMKLSKSEKVIVGSQLF